MLVTPLGNLSLLILKPVSLTLSLLLDDEPLVDPEDDDADDCDEHCEAGLISFDQIESHLNGSRGEQVENSFLLKRDHTGKIHFN